MARLAFSIAQAAPTLVALGPVAGLACLFAASLAALRPAPAA